MCRISGWTSEWILVSSSRNKVLVNGVVVSREKVSPYRKVTWCFLNRIVSMKVFDLKLCSTRTKKYPPKHDVHVS